MNKKQVAWAEGHNWFISAGGYRVGRILKMSVLVVDNLTDGGTRVFSNYSEIRKWAGY